MKILAVGDLVGESGVKKLKEILPNFRKENNIDFVIVNAENSAGGMGITTKIFNDLKLLGYDISLINKIIMNYSFENDEFIAKKEYDKLFKRLSRKYSGSELKNKIREKLFQKGLQYEEE